MTSVRVFSWSLLSLSWALSTASAQTIMRHSLTVASNPVLAVSNEEVDTIIAEMIRILRAKSYP